MAKRKKSSRAKKPLPNGNGFWKALNGNEVLLIGLAAVIAILGLVLMILKAL